MTRLPFIGLTIVCAAVVSIIGWAAESDSVLIVPSGRLMAASADSG